MSDIGVVAWSVSLLGELDAWLGFVKLSWDSSGGDMLARKTSNKTAPNAIL